MVKRKQIAGLRTTRPLKLSELRDAGTVRIDLWSMEDPAKSYEATACAVLARRREFILVFGQIPPWSSTPVTAVSVGIPAGDLKNQLGAFSDIRERLKRQDFEDEEVERTRLDVKTLVPTADNYVHEAAQVIRAACSDDLAVLDFYKRPWVTDAIIEARPNERLELIPVLRLCCSAIVLASMLQLLESELEVGTNA